MHSMIYSDIEYLFINLGYKNLNLSQGPSNNKQNRRAYSEQTARTVRTAQTSNKYRDYSDAQTSLFQLVFFQTLDVELT